jgi:hypothetical protein
MQTERANIEVIVDWNSRDASHRERHYFSRINFWRDFFPMDFAERLKQQPENVWISASVPTDEVLPPRLDSLVYAVPLKEQYFRLGKRGKVQPRIGHFYPRKFIAGFGDVYADDMRPMRLLSMDESKMVLDLNHPLSQQQQLTVSMRVEQWLEGGAEHGGRCNDPVLETVEGGPGYQAEMPQGHTDFFDATAFERVDEDDDTVFYHKPRLIGHLDSLASAHIGELYAHRLTPDMHVLDLMSSCESHLPPSLDAMRLTGLGLNLEEMDANPALDQHVVHDLNRNSALPFDDNSFDAIICTASVEYLTRPFEVMRELARVVKPGGDVMFAFADRWFPPKAIRLWSEVHAFERMAVMLAYFRDSGLFTDFYTETARGWPRPEDDKYAAKLADSDPVFFVSAKTVG